MFANRDEWLKNSTGKRMQIAEERRGRSQTEKRKNSKGANWMGWKIFRRTIPSFRSRIARAERSTVDKTPSTRLQFITGAATLTQSRWTNTHTGSQRDAHTRPARLEIEWTSARETMARNGTRARGEKWWWHGFVNERKTPQGQSRAVGLLVMAAGGGLRGGATRDKREPSIN